jgi:hypothetical protein
MHIRILFIHDNIVFTGHVLPYRTRTILMVSRHHHRTDHRDVSRETELSKFHTNNPNNVNV